MEIEISKLPKDKQDAINSSNWVKETEEIGKKFSLTEDEINSLQTEVGLMLIGFVRPDNYIKNIEDNIIVSKNTAEQIFNEIFKKIFTDIAKKMELVVKNKIKSETPSWDQTINFILSGGDYSFFIEKPIVIVPTVNLTNIKNNFSI
jgi:hypothetical protein